MRKENLMDRKVKSNRRTDLGGGERRTKNHGQISAQQLGGFSLGKPRQEGGKGVFIMHPSSCRWRRGCL